MQTNIYRIDFIPVLRLATLKWRVKMTDIALPQAEVLRMMGVFCRVLFFLNGTMLIT